MPDRGSLPDAGDLLGGKYSITRVIGAGGMGVVFEAMHIKLRQRVAVKMLLPDLATRGDIVARFEREARAAAQLRSPHVARVIDVDALADGTPYMVMEFLEGRDLAAELTSRGALPIAEAVDYLLQTCDAMAEAHRVGTIHRDLKPSNLFLTDDGRRKLIKVLDFGISKVAGDGTSPSVTSTFSALGTALYMSPEQVRSAKHVDARSDVWALGVVLYELLANRPPFEGETATAVAAAVVADQPTPLRSLRQDLPEQLEAAIMTALEKNRDMRFQDAAAFAGAIAPFAVATARPVAGSAPQNPSIAQLKDAIPFEEEETELLAQAPVAVRAAYTQPVVPPLAPAQSGPQVVTPPATAASWSAGSSRPALSSPRRYLVLVAVALGLIAIGSTVVALSGSEEPPAASALSIVAAPPPPSAAAAQPSATPAESEIPILDLSSPASAAAKATKPSATPKSVNPASGTPRAPEPSRASPKVPAKPAAKPATRAGLPDNPG